VLRCGEVRLPGSPIGSSVDTAIWTKPCEDLAGQLLYGDSMQRSHLVPRWTVTSFGAF
jgi:hypothetical protein